MQVRNKDIIDIIDIGIKYRKLDVKTQVQNIDRIDIIDIGIKYRHN